MLSKYVDPTKNAQRGMEIIRRNIKTRFRVKVFPSQRILVKTKSAILDMWLKGKTKITLNKPNKYDELFQPRIQG